ncbi:hypothetical protein BO78DRAFT_35545 [Aspergillus sclerotiicarbonarius CBS 121057]|uniref:Uncharacterized protein n=1 Tax=Aspergillus sclerotiicarbonarius (strain CBS 121057 / IBT 28362) TaxID=1448318 RepID=A0A319DSQ3_ASPSB|nr:hypothetical protein BO78DRAFT_35545 [Aspergillus sclerotiicarbonarius CBS 121057]
MHPSSPCSLVCLTSETVFPQPRVGIHGYPGRLARIYWFHSDMEAWPVAVAGGLWQSGCWMAGCKGSEWQQQLHSWRTRKGSADRPIIFGSSSIITTNTLWAKPII